MTNVTTPLPSNIKVHIYLNTLTSTFTTIFYPLENKYFPLKLLGFTNSLFYKQKILNDLSQTTYDSKEKLPNNTFILLVFKDKLKYKFDSTTILISSDSINRNSSN